MNNGMQEETPPTSRGSEYRLFARLDDDPEGTWREVGSITEVNAYEAVKKAVSENSSLLDAVAEEKLEIFAVADKNLTTRRPSVTKPKLSL